MPGRAAPTGPGGRGDAVRRLLRAERRRHGQRVQRRTALGAPAFEWDLARDIAVMPDGDGYVVLTGIGTVYKYGRSRSRDSLGPDSADAPLNDQVELFPGRRGAGRIFYNQNRLSGRVPQICCLFGPSAAGGAYIPAFSDVVFMVEGNASMYLGSPRMVEMVVGERTTLEEMGGARMHATVSGSGDNLAVDDADAIAQARAYFAYMPQSWRSAGAEVRGRGAGAPLTADVVPADERVAFDMHELLDGVVDADSFFEVKPLFAPEVIVGLRAARGRPIGIVASNSVHKGGALFVDSSDKAARFIWCCDAFGIPLVFLADVPGFMVGTEVERQGIIRHGAKMITAVSEATVPKVSVIVRKAYGAGLYAFAGPAFGPTPASRCRRRASR